MKVKHEDIVIIYTSSGSFLGALTGCIANKIYDKKEKVK